MTLLTLDEISTMLKMKRGYVRDVVVKREGFPKPCVGVRKQRWDARATALTLMARRMDVLTLARISRHKDLKLLISTYYRESPEDISRRL